MKQYLLPMTLRLLAFIAPPLLLYVYAQHAFEQARRQEHHGDTGLGIALLLGFMTLAMLVGFLIDFIVQLCRRRFPVGAADALVLCLLLMPFAWVACNWFGPPDRPGCGIPVAVFGQVLSWLQL